MRFSLIFTESYEKIEGRFLKRHPDLLERYYKTLAILEQDPFHPSLRLHALKGRLAGLHAVSITCNIALLWNWSYVSRRSFW
jgi:proteic killer suppression protein